MGEVFLAEHELLKRPCAVKLIRPEVVLRAGTIDRFEREVRINATLSHPNTVEIFDYGRTEDGTYYYVMEYLPGMSLADLVERHGPLPPGRAVYLLRQVALALQEAHEAGLIHRDIKPSNIFAARRGGMDDVAKLLDFGLVRPAATASSPRTSDEGQILGTPLYMSPEQATNSRPLDARSDIYSLGAVAYYLLTGRPPFDEGTRDRGDHRSRPRPGRSRHRRFATGCLRTWTPSSSVAWRKTRWNDFPMRKVSRSPWAAVRAHLPGTRLWPGNGGMT